MFGNLLNSKVSVGHIGHTQSNQLSFVNILSGENNIDAINRMSESQQQHILNNMALLAAADIGGENNTLSNTEIDKNWNY